MECVSLTEIPISGKKDPSNSCNLSDTSSIDKLFDVKDVKSKAELFPNESPPPYNRAMEERQLMIPESVVVDGEDSRVINRANNLVVLAENMRDSEPDCDSSHLINIGTGEFNQGGRSVFQKNRIRERRVRCCRVWCCGIFIAATLLTLLSVGVHLYSKGIQHYANLSLQLFRQLTHFGQDNFVGCSELQVEDVWNKGFSRLSSNGAIRLLDVNEDGVDDIILPYGTGVDKSLDEEFARDPTCQIYFNGDERCYGGVMALNGKNGDLLWDYKSLAEIDSVLCNYDLNGDKKNDCVISGKLGTCAAINGLNGEELWTFNEANEAVKTNFYTPLFIPDVDRDNIVDIIQMHGGSSQTQTVARLVVLSGKTGELLIGQPVPDNHESYSSPVMVSLGDDIPAVLFGTGSESVSGSMYIVRLDDLLGGRLVSKSKKLISSLHRGVMSPPVLVDITGDGWPEIVSCPFSEQCLALEGRRYFRPFWTFKANSSQTYSMPAVGFFNHDDVPDVMVQMNVAAAAGGSRSQANILDGKNGQLLASIDTGNNGIVSSPLVVSLEGFGNDLFLYWSQTCPGYENSPGERWTPAWCQAKHNTTTESRFHALTNGLKRPGKVIYSSTAHSADEHSTLASSKKSLTKFLADNPELRPYFRDFEEEVNRAPETMRHAWDEETRDENGAFYGHSYREKRSSGKFRRVKRIHRASSRNVPVQRLMSTGTLAKSMRDPDASSDPYSSSVDVVFATYWTQDKQLSETLPEEEACNRKWAKIADRRRNPSSPFYRMSLESYLAHGQQACAEKYRSRIPAEELEAARMRALFNIRDGQLTVYRKRLTCRCDAAALPTGKQCSHILPFDQQAWPQYLGRWGTAFWRRGRD